MKTFPKRNRRKYLSKLYDENKLVYLQSDIMYINNKLKEYTLSNPNYTEEEYNKYKKKLCLDVS